MPTNYYQVLGIDPRASESEIKEKFRSLALEVHPDINVSQTALEKFVNIKEAYDVLTDPEKRAVHDKENGIINYTPPKESFKDTTHRILRDKLEEELEEDLESEEEETGSHILNDLLSPITTLVQKVSDKIEPLKKLKSNSKPTSSIGTFKRETLEKVKRERTFAFKIGTLESILGTSRKVVLDGGKQSLEIKIPPGISDQSILRAIARGGSEIKAKVHIEKDKFLSRSGFNITLSVPVTPEQLESNNKIELYSAMGLINITLPQESGAKLRVPGHGILNPKTDTRGDLFIRTISASGNIGQRQKDVCNLLRPLSFN